jgi:eukaryotic translation initiation factor 2C
VASPVSSGKKEAKAAAAEQESSTGTTKKRHVEVAPLLAIQNARGLKDVMWYI